MTASTLIDRSIIRLSCEDVRGFLDGLVTSSVTGDLPVYAALLTPQGKVIADFFISADGDDLLLDVHTDDADALIRRLSMYRLRRPITIARDETLAVHWSPEPGNDPRLAELGTRSLGPAGEPTGAYLAHRLALGVAEGPELTDLLWLECNAAELGGVSFTKGCFVGQENTARMNWRSKVNRRLFVVPATALPDRGRAFYPELGLAIVHARTDALPPDALIPAWLEDALVSSG
ncbi:CAF17-like 4Fe-4S cluster assembly/insertion protein YgfZ [Sphingomonas sp. RB1R13]|uniref:CAF17-like 4Fe-4S cluster assembly/insertion protein YgfZ n=1 Tax=Sphingomonas sp. RB1R13 TaxID=3096159 RepID=UPI002FCC168C